MKDACDSYCYRDQEVLAMIELCRDNAQLDWLADVIISLSSTGMRISELASRRWSDISFESNVLSIQDESKSKRSGKQEVRTTKTGHSRSFPIHPGLLSTLKKLYEQNQSGPVFLAARGGILRPGNVRDQLIKRVIRPLQHRFPSGEDEIGFKDGRLHSFRHYFCSQCANQNVPELMLMRWLGHRSSGMVKRYYHLNDQVSQKQMQSLKFPGSSDAT